MLTEIRLAVRTLLKQPRFTIVAALTLALGIGSVTAIFSVVNGVLLRPLPYSEPDRLVNLWSHAPGVGLDRFALSPDLYFFLRGEVHSYADMTMFRRRDANLTESANPEVVPAAETTFTYFSTFGIAPAAGQVFTDAHDKPGAPFVTVISDRLWHRRFGADAAVVGRTVQIDGETATILGVLPPALDENGSPDLWLPARLDQARPPTGTFGWPVSARLKPGVTAQAAEAELAPVLKRLLDGFQGGDYRAFLEQGKYRISVNSVRDDVIGDVREPLWILLGTVGFVLLIACANVANLFLIRAEGRQREVAVRAALGATRGMLVRAQLVEAFVLAAIGGGLGVLVAAVSIPALIRAAPTTIPRLNTVHIDLPVLIVAAGATALAALIFGIVPAFRYTRRAALGSLRQGGRGATVGRASHRGRRLLVVVQTAMTLVLLVGSGLLVRSFARMSHADLGFSPRDVLSFRVALPRSSYPDPAHVLDFEKRLIESLGALPGVVAAGAGSNLPMTSGASGTAFAIDGRPTPAGQLPPIVRYRFTSPGYVETMGLRVLQGRTFDQRDLKAGSRDILVNKAAADAFWPGVDPIGKRMRPSGDSGNDWYTVVGVVGSELQDGFRKDPPLMLYWGLGAPFPDGARTLGYVLRGPTVTQNPSAVRTAVWAIDPRLPVAMVQTMDEIVSRSIVPFTFTMLTLGLAAAMALTLGMIGLYGVLSYTVTLRVREIGVRLALGAQPRRLMRAVVGQGIALAVIGLAVGIAGAIALTRLLTDMLYGTQPLDVVTYLAMSAALVLVAALASYLPARRAASVSPLESLKNE